MTNTPFFFVFFFTFP
ncbi:MULTISPECIES: hypothetical protein [Brenneria]|uniref:Uncharacterized protein n=1 Tax=Brenneria tiliae TaxID=2914984 RepID=A0ABT0MN66_9GAMM|nr:MULTISPECIES: hypothetical protein [Brenneria]MCL2891280.1 hypothetical protein [Brenneria tiliae]MCL2896038.1 hypothetical protein [Brenneria tiliae]MCL2900428.1 hypothetical protein [Brenneria tiliae]